MKNERLEVNKISRKESCIQELIEFLESHSCVINVSCVCVYNSPFVFSNAGKLSIDDLPAIIRWINDGNIKDEVDRGCLLYEISKIIIKKNCI